MIYSQNCKVDFCFTSFEGAVETFWNIYIWYGMIYICLVQDVSIIISMKFQSADFTIPHYCYNFLSLCALEFSKRWSKSRVISFTNAIVSLHQTHRESYEPTTFLQLTSDSVLCTEPRCYHHISKYLKILFITLLEYNSHF